MAQNRTLKVVPMHCALCGGWGFRLPFSIDRAFKSLIPFAVLFREALPCSCKAGALFLADRNRYNEVPVSRASSVIPFTTDRTA